VTSYELEQNYPNPFNPATMITFALPEAGEVSLSIYNMSGQLVRKLVQGEYASGRYQVLWNATDDRGARVASGLYLYVLKAGAFTAQRKLMLMK
jgi:flagellar hook assembly protein FlgD